MHTSNSLSVTDTTPLKKQVTDNNMVGNCIFAIFTTAEQDTIYRKPKINLDNRTLLYLENATHGV